MMLSCFVCVVPSIHALLHHPTALPPHPSLLLCPPAVHLPFLHYARIFFFSDTKRPRQRHKRPRMEDLVKVPGLQLPLRENRLLVQEFNLQQW